MGSDNERGYQKFARTDRGLWLRCEWSFANGYVALAYQQRRTLTAQGIVVLDQNGDLLDVRPHTGSAQSVDEFVEVMPRLPIDTPEFLDFAGEALRECIESIQSLWLEMARIGVGDSLEELCEVFAVPWEGKFLTDLCMYDIRQGHGPLAGLDGMQFRLSEGDGRTVSGRLYVRDELQSFPFEAPASTFFFQSFLRSCVPSRGGDQLLQLRMRQK
jgi:hypothetical protein